MHWDKNEHEGKSIYSTYSDPRQCAKATRRKICVLSTDLMQLHLTLYKAIDINWSILMFIVIAQ